MATINGTGGNDTLTGTGAADLINAFGGNDSVLAGGGRDTVFGGTGDDTIDGEAGNDSLLGDDGNDSLIGGAGNDSLFGGNNNDTLIGGAGNDSLDGGSGTDFASYAASGAAVSINFSTSIYTGGDAAGDTLSGIEGVIGSAFADTLVGANGADIFDGGAGTDSLVGNGGNDTIAGGDGNDSIFGGIGADSLDGGLGNDLISGGAGGDSITGGDGLDTIVSGDGADTVDGGAGNDSIDAGAGADSVSGGTGDDSIVGGGGGDTIAGGDGNDTILGDNAVTATSANESLNWSLAGADETDISNGFVQDTGQMDVRVSFVTSTFAPTMTVESTDTVFIGGGEPMSATSNLALTGGGGVGTSSTTYIDFAASAGSGVTDEVNNVQFRINDIDTGGWQDIVTINAYDADGNPVTVTITLSGNDSVSGNTITAGPTSDTASSALGSALIDIAGPVARIEIIYANGNTGGQALWVSDVFFDTIPQVAGNDSIDGGLGDDSILGGGGNDTLLGSDGNDTLRGEDGDDMLFGGIGIDSLDGGLGADTIDGGTEADSIDGGDGNDSLLGGAGTFADTILGGLGDDTLRGDAGNDSLFGGAGNDSIDGGTGNDTIDGGTEADSVDGGDGNDSILGGTGTFADTLLGGAGDDTLHGDAGNDSLVGGTGADSLDGGLDNDILFGGTGAFSDTLSGGAGQDTLDGGGAGGDILTGGADQDLIRNVGIGDVVDGNETGTDFDTLDLTTWGKALTNIIYDPMNAENGTVQFLDNLGNIIGSMTFSNIENVIPCFTPGTLIETDRGPLPVDAIAPGCRVLTRDSGYRPVRWAGRRDLGAGDLFAKPELAPVLIRRGALGPDLPLRDMLVSPQHRMLLTGARAELISGETEVLAAALHLVGQPGIERADRLAGVSYVHIMFDNHEIVRADGAWSESFQPGDTTLEGMDDAQRSEILALFPELASAAGRQAYAAARHSLKAHEVRAMLAA